MQHPRRAAVATTASHDNNLLLALQCICHTLRLAMTTPTTTKRRPPLRFSKSSRLPAGSSRQQVARAASWRQIYIARLLHFNGRLSSRLSSSRGCCYCRRCCYYLPVAVDVALVRCCCVSAAPTKSADEQEAGEEKEEAEEDLEAEEAAADRGDSDQNPRECAPK